MKKFLLFFGISFLAFSCGDSVLPFIVYDVETDYMIQMREDLSEDKQELKLEISSLVGFSCEDAEIITQSSILDGSINIEIKEIRLPAGCGEGQNLARTSLNLGILTEGNYNLTLSIGETVFNYGILSVAPNSYKLVFEDDLNGIDIPDLSMDKIPSGTIWGRIKFNDSNAATLVNELTNTLDQFGATNRVLPTGKYTNVRINEEGHWIWDEENSYLYEGSIAYSYSGDNINLLSVALDSFNTEFGNTYDFDLDVFTYTGLEF